MKSTALILSILVLSSFGAGAQAYVDIKGEVKTSYTTGVGFSGERLSLRMNGAFSDKFSYAVYHNFQKPITKSSLFNATDWAYVEWQPTEHWSFCAGKQMMYVGGIEYDHRTVDIVYASNWWNNAAIFKFGVTGKFHYNEGRSVVAFEVSESPLGSGTDIGLNLYWNPGTIGHYTPIFSTNLFQFGKGEFQHVVALGNKIGLEPVTFEFDLIHSADIHDYNLFKDFTVIGLIRWDITEKLSAFTKGIYEKVPEHSRYSPIAGITSYKAGGGLEYSPISAVRFHAVFYRYSEKNILTLGVCWFPHIYCNKK